MTHEDSVWNRPLAWVFQDFEDTGSTIETSGTTVVNQPRHATAFQDDPDMVQET